MSQIYILELENNKFYVGKSNNINYRYLQHLNGKGTEFTKLYQPIKIYKVYNNISEFDEDNYTKLYMKLYGIHNVRGGSYCNIYLTKDEIILLNKELNTINNECYRCGRKSHFIKNCYAKTHINGELLNDYQLNNNYLIDQTENNLYKNTIPYINTAFNNTMSVAKTIYRYFKY